MCVPVTVEKGSQCKGLWQRTTMLMTEHRLSIATYSLALANSLKVGKKPNPNNRTNNIKRTVLARIVQVWIARSGSIPGNDHALT